MKCAPSLKVHKSHIPESYLPSLVTCCENMASHREQIMSRENTKVSNSLCGPYTPLSVAKVQEHSKLSTCFLPCAYTGYFRAKMWNAPTLNTKARLRLNAAMRFCATQQLKGITSYTRLKNSGAHTGQCDRCCPLLCWGDPCRLFGHYCCDVIIVTSDWNNHLWSPRATRQIATMYLVSRYVTMGLWCYAVKGIIKWVLLIG